LAAAEKRGIARDEAKGKRAAAALEREDWRLLERAVGPNGIQALELDALAPSIMSVSNALLSEAYGSRYQLEVRTTRIAGTGSQKKQVEAFEIFVLDTESGDEQEIATLSGGEAVWIRKDLYDGFAIIRARNTGTKFQTVFLDEADGALDPAARMLYLRMLEAAHRASGRFQTIIITHSTELQAMVEQVIDIAALGPRKDKA
jgi:exonuclease SbcC